MNSRPTDCLVRCGTFLYDGSVRCVVEIWQTDFRPGSGDHEDPDDIREDAHGTFFEIRYRWPGERSQAGGGYCDSLAEATAAVEATVEQVTWE